MADISTFYPAIVDCAVKAVRIVIAIIFSAVVIPWVKGYAIPWLKEKQLYGMIQRFVRAAEKLGEAGTISKDAKLDYVTGLLGKRGVDVTADVRALIESAVGSLDDEITHGMISLVEALSTAGDVDEIVFEGGKATLEVEVPSGGEHAPEDGE